MHKKDDDLRKLFEDLEINELINDRDETRKKAQENIERSSKRIELVLMEKGKLKIRID